MSKALNADSILDLLNTLTPFIRMAGGPDIPTEVEKVEPILGDVENLLKEGMEAVGAVRRGLANGSLTHDELNEIIKEGGDLVQATHVIWNRISPPNDAGAVEMPAAAAPPGTDGLEDVPHVAEEPNR